jgi:hypothetical protein
MDARSLLWCSASVPTLTVGARDRSGRQGLASASREHQCGVTAPWRWSRSVGFASASQTARCAKHQEPNRSTPRQIPLGTAPRTRTSDRAFGEVAQRNLPSPKPRPGASTDLPQIGDGIGARSPHIRPVTEALFPRGVCPAKGQGWTPTQAAPGFKCSQGAACSRQGARGARCPALFQIIQITERPWRVLRVVKQWSPLEC